MHILLYLLLLVLGAVIWILLILPLKICPDSSILIIVQKQALQSFGILNILTDIYLFDLLVPV